MAIQTKDKKIRKKKPVFKSSREIIYTTDPQDYMEGPVSSIVHTVKVEVEKNDMQSKEEASQKRDKNM